MAYVKAETEREQDYFDFLEELRQSGKTNMFGAAPYLQKAFKLNREKAKEVLLAWMYAHSDPTKRIAGAK